MYKTSFKNALGIDVGEKRIGIARVNAIARLPEPLVTMSNSDTFSPLLNELIKEHDIDILIVGLPRNLSGEETQQSSNVRQFVADKIVPFTQLPIVFQDETLSTVSAESSNSREKINKFGIDSLAAVEILDDYLKGLDS